jgi:integrase
LTEEEKERNALFNQENLSEAATTGGENELPLKFKYGNGTISKRSRENKDGTTYHYWQARYFVNGEQKTVTAKTEKECAAKLKAIREKYTIPKQNAANGNKKYGDITYGEFLEIWLTTYKKPNLEASSYKVISGKIRKHVIPTLGKLKLRKITSSEIRDFLNTYSVGSTRDELKIYIKDSFNAAMLEPYNLKKNPVADIKLSKHKLKHHRALTFTEQKILLEKSEPKYGAVFYFLFCTGLRISEFLALNPKTDIDLENNIIRINKTYEMSTKKIKSYTKTKRDRKIQFIPELFDKISEILGDRELFGQYTYSQIYDYIKAVSEENNIADASLHSTRSTFASVLHHIGMPYKYVQNWLGHEKADMTLDVYTEILGKGTSPVLEYFIKLKISLML